MYYDTALFLVGEFFFVFRMMQRGRIRVRGPDPAASGGKSGVCDNVNGGYMAPGI